MTHKDLAKIQQAVYTSPSDLDYYNRGVDSGDVVWGTKQVEGITVITLRGSVTVEDWVRDFRALSNPFEHGTLGHVHPGFYAGMMEAYASIRVKTKGPRIIIGHSLGAARAAILTALFVNAGESPLERVVWGEPKAGFKDFCRIVARVPGSSYRNGNTSGHDIVTDVPLTLSLEDYERASPLMDVCCPPRSGCLDFPIHPAAWHSMELYVQATPETLCRTAT